MEEKVKLYHTIMRPGVGSFGVSFIAESSNFIRSLFHLARTFR